MISSRVALRFAPLRPRLGKAKRLNEHAALRNGVIATQEKSPVLPFSDIPRPKGLPFIGNVADYRRHGGTEKVVLIHQRYFKELGPIFLESIFGRTMLHVMDPADFATVYRCEGRYPNRPLVDPWVAYRDMKDYHRGLPQR